MSKKILIEGIIGWDMNENQLRDQLEKANGDSIDLEINTPGGFVFNGITMFNLIRDYAKNKNNVTATITGLAASMGSYIALAANKVIAYDNSIYMIHNVQSIAVGDYRELQKEAKEIEALTNLLADAYSQKTKKTKKEIRKMMDDESFFHGQEMKDAGFVDEIIKTKDDDNNNDDKVNKDLNITLAQGKIKDCFSKIAESERAKGDIKKAASLIDLTAYQENSVNEKQIENKPDILPTNKREEKKKMDLNEFKNTYPDLYQEVINLGVNQERERVTAHLKLGKQSNAIEKSIDFIQNGNLVTEQNVFADYMAEGMKNQMKTARTEDNPPAINTPVNETNDIDDTEKAIAEYKKTFGGKK